MTVVGGVILIENAAETGRVWEPGILRDDMANERECLQE